MNRALGVLGLLVVVCLVTGISNPNFVGAYNVGNLLEWSSLYAIIGIGVAFVIATGGIDLSIGSVVALVGVLLGVLLDRGTPAWLALGLIMVICAVIGLSQGLLVTRLKLQPFVVTLCGLFVFRGLARWTTGDLSVGTKNAPEWLRRLTSEAPLGLGLLLVIAGLGVAVLGALRWRAARRRADMIALALGAGMVAGGLALQAAVPELGAPSALCILLVLAVLAAVFLHATVPGRHLLAAGRSEEAARFSGIRTERVVTLAYVLSALCAGIAGILFALEVGTVAPSIHGNFYELYAIAAAVLGGCSLRGGQVTVVGVVLGAAVVRVLYNAITLLQLPTELEFAIVGAALLAGVVGDELVRRLVARRTSR